jgi:OOP family OmpA-OmpF porin
MFDRRALAACCVLAIPSAACLAQNTFTADTYFDNR